MLPDTWQIIHIIVYISSLSMPSPILSPKSSRAPVTKPSATPVINLT